MPAENMDYYKAGTANRKVCCTAFAIENRKKHEDGQGCRRLQGKDKCLAWVYVVYECIG